MAKTTKAVTVKFKQLKAMRDDAMTWDAISEKIGVSTPVLNRIWKSRKDAVVNVRPRNGKTTKKTSSPKLTDQVAAANAALLIANNTPEGSDLIREVVNIAREAKATLLVVQF